MTEWDYKAELKYLMDLIERGKRGERVEMSPARVLERLGCIAKEMRRQRMLNAPYPAEDSQ